MTSVWDQYPILQPGNDIHLNMKGGTLFMGYDPISLSIEEADFLAACDGVHKVVDAVPRSWSEDYGDLKFLMLISRLVSSGHLILADEPSQSSIRITGSRSAYIPPHMSIELTAGCNLRCRHCYRESEPSKDEYMPTETLLNVLERLAESGLRSVELTGGEPLLHKDFLRILSFCADRFELVGVLSNGTLITHDMAERFRSLGDRLLLSISLDCSEEDAHDLRRGVPGAFRRTVDNIKLLSDLGVKVRVSMCVDEESFSDIEKTLLLARDLGAAAFSYTPVLPLGRGREWAPPGWNLDGREVMQAEEELARRYRGFLSVLSDEAVCSLEKEEGCGAGYRTYAMDPWGNIRPCATFGPEEMVIGNLVEGEIEEVFSNPLTEALAGARVPGNEVCGDCEMSLFCRYCILRGILGSKMVRDCSWINLPSSRRILNISTSVEASEMGHMSLDNKI
ncbi:radical SAM/SPASM domain-containing protein [Candidatus Methanocrinis alkalitolerans]|nr:radical SAM protein [Candidatus Methanocrinis alkalitolerans]MCR3882913.1 radical SAM protein [Methanothrix sp.]